MKEERSILTDFGGQGEVVILLHGFLASSKYWRRLQPYLTQAGYRVITLDLLGFGKAVNLPASIYDYDEHIAHIHHYVAPLKLKAPYTLLGHSMGALLAARYSLLYPKEIKKLFLLHPPLYKNRSEARTTLRNTGRTYRLLLDSHARELGWKLMKYTPKIPISAHSFASRERSMRHIIEAAELSEDLINLKVSTTLLIGSKDRAEYIKNLVAIRNATSVSITVMNLSHHSPFLNPKLISNLIITST
jgi:cis-3-alkyl-4-acyloxetan-2-one decarboxylase